MGYRVGWQCLSDSEQAHDYLLSQAPPAITADGQLIRPVKQGADWYLGRSKINLSFPECDHISQIQYGALFAVPIIGLVSLVFFFRMAKKLINSMSVGGDKDDT